MLSNKTKPEKSNAPKDPDAPKRPLSAYFLFCAKERTEVQKELSSCNGAEVTKELGKRWALLDPEAKKVFEEASKKDKGRYEKDMKSYKPSKNFLKSYKRFKCEKCEQCFISKNALSKHTTSIHKADIGTNEEYKNETVENEEEVKKIEACEACRYCKTFFNPVDTGLAPCPARTDQKLDFKSEFDADTYFEAFYKESMGDYLFFAEEVDPLSKEDVDILKEGGKDKNATSPLCSECTDDFYWPLAPNQVFSPLMLHLSHFSYYKCFTQFYCFLMPSLMSRVRQSVYRRHSSTIAR